MTVRWDIHREGRAWGEADDFWARWELAPETFEAYEGKLFWHENERINLLALLLEQVRSRGCWSRSRWRIPD